MIVNKFGETVLDSKDIFEALYAGKITSFKNINVTDQTLVSQFNQHVESNADNIDKLSLYAEPDCSIQQFDKHNQAEWYIPDTYKDFDISSWLLSQCRTQIETDRVLDELQLFVQYEMINILVCLKYLVDFMRSNNIVWGLGRGSSVASYCLYLIGVHKINSIKFSLDIREFLKGEKQ